MDAQTSIKRPEIWGGIECTINRIGNTYKDQLRYSGHYDRAGDISAIAVLGIKHIRYPVLWEKHRPEKNAKTDWRWADRQLYDIRTSGMKPIVGLLHHGSGPRYTDLLDPEFPYLLADYAYEVASRYPWIEDYTPVNEPLTTARFSGLYGHWYPHHACEVSFYKMLLNQLKGTILSMEAIHSVNPAVRLIQTEDLGKTYSTPLLAYQANFENERRLLTFDILTGRLLPGHPQYEYLLGCGIPGKDLEFFQNHSFAPHILGLNYYITSERWLDESLNRYPHHSHGGNGKHRYADTEAVRADIPNPGGFKKLAAEIWERYQIPMAVTECHLHCTREEQLRWFKEIWDDTSNLIKQGIDIKAVTAWALLGSFDWDSLLTRTGTQYESGVFDIKTFSGLLRSTAMGPLLKTLSAGDTTFHPVLSAPGWWHNSHKEKALGRPVIIVKPGTAVTKNDVNSDDVSAVLVSACKQRRIQSIVSDDLDDEAIEILKPWAVINLSCSDAKFQSICLREKIQYVSFCLEETVESGLKIVIEKLPVSIHQVNKVLDLMVDGDEGCWIFGSDEKKSGHKDLIGSKEWFST